MLSPNLGQLEGEKADAPLPHILEDLSAITGTPLVLSYPPLRRASLPKLTGWIN